MKNSRKNVILAAILGVLLLILVAVLTVQYVKEQRLKKEEKSKHIELCTDEELLSLSILHSDGVEMLIRLGNDKSIRSVTYDGTEYPLERLDITEIRKMISQILSFSIGNSFEASGTDMSSYGLSPEVCRVTVGKKDGSSSVLLLGNLNANKSGIYVCRSGENKVSVAEYSLYQTISLRFEDLLNKLVLNYTRQEVNRIDFERRSTGERWTILPQEDYDNGVYLEPRYQVTYPMEREPKDALVSLANHILQLRVTQYVPITEDAFESYGLSDPEYTFNIRLNSGENVEVFLSMELGGYYYGYCSNSPYTFCIDSGYLKGINNSAFELIDSNVIHGYLDDVRSVSVTIKDTTFEIEILLSLDLSFLSDDTVFTLDKRNAKVYSSQGDCYGLLLFESIFWMPVSSVDYDASPALENVEATISVVKTSSEQTTLKLVPKGDNEYYCFINDRYSGFIVDRSVLYKDNGHQLSGFGVWDAYLLANEAIDNKNVNDVYDRP